MHTDVPECHALVTLSVPTLSPSAAAHLVRYAAMKRITLTAVLTTAIGCSVGGPGQSPPRQFSVIEATIPEMRAAMEQRRLTSRELVTQYLVRIATYEP